MYLLLLLHLPIDLLADQEIFCSIQTFDDVLARQKSYLGCVRLVGLLFSIIESFGKLHSFEEQANHFWFEQVFIDGIALINLRFGPCGVATEGHLGAFNKYFQKLDKSHEASHFLRKMTGRLCLSYWSSIVPSYLLLVTTCTGFLLLRRDGKNVQRSGVINLLRTIFGMLEHLEGCTLAQQIWTNIIIS